MTNGSNAPGADGSGGLAEARRPAAPSLIEADRGPGDRSGDAGGPTIRRIGHVQAFASDIDAFAVPGHRALNQALLAAIADLRSRDDGIRASNAAGWHSRRDLFEWTDPAFVTLRTHIVAALTLAIRRYWPEYDPARGGVLIEAWVNVNGTGAFNAPHDHGAFHLSGCYYIAVPEAPGLAASKIEFANPAGAMNQPMDFGKRMFRSKYAIVPKEGLLLTFPAYLQHWVYPNQAAAERFTIGFNALVHQTIEDQQTPR